MNVLSVPRIRRLIWAEATRISGVVCCSPSVRAISSAADGTGDPWLVPAAQDGAQRVEDGWVFDGGGYGFVLAVGDAAHRLAQYLARAGLGKSRDHIDPAQRGDRADLVADQLDQLGGQGGRVSTHAGLEHHEPAGYLALELVVHPDHSAFGHRGVAGEH